MECARIPPGPTIDGDTGHAAAPQPVFIILWGSRVGLAALARAVRSRGSLVRARPSRSPRSQRADSGAWDGTDFDMTQVRSGWDLRHVPLITEVGASAPRTHARRAGRAPDRGRSVGWSAYQPERAGVASPPSREMTGSVAGTRRREGRPGLSGSGPLQLAT